MKKILFFTCLFCITLAINAQDLISKIPHNAKAVIAIKGKNITDLVSIAEFENSKIGKEFLKEIRKKFSSIDDMGLDLNRSFYYFMTSDTLKLTHNFLIPLKNKAGFESLLSERDKNKIVTEASTSYFVDSYDDTVIIWNDNTLLVTVNQRNNRYNDYGYNDYYNDSLIEDADEGVVEVPYAVESAKEILDYPIMTFNESEYDFGHIIDGDVVEHTFKFTNTGDTDLVITDAKASCGCTVPSYPKTAIAPGASGNIDVSFNSSNKSGRQNKSITITANTEDGSEGLKIKGFVNPKGTKLEDIVEETIESTEDYEVVEDTAIEVPKSEPINDSYEEDRKKREALQLEKNEVLIASAKTTMAGNYSNGNILKNQSFAKALGNGKDEAVVWLEDLGSIYTNFFQEIVGYGVGYNLGLYNGLNKLYGDMSLTSKLNFEKTQVNLKTSYSMNDEVAGYAKAMYNGKMNSNYFKYFNEDNMLGYFSINANTKGALETYPKMMGNLFENSGDDEMASIMPIGMRVLSLLLDEEGAAKIIRGDMLFVLTEMKERDVTYTTYDYDDNYNRTQIEKTKKETLPDFLMMITSSEEDLFHRLMNFSVKESRGEITLNEDGMYQINNNDLPYNVNVIFKDNTIIIGSSPTDMAAIYNGTYKGKVSGKHKKIISKNSSAIYVNGKQIASKLPKDIMPRDLRERMDYITENSEDVIFKMGKMKGNTMKGEMILNTPEKGHDNSLFYFINMIDALID